jgi:hypothetical protein
MSTNFKYGDKLKHKYSSATAFFSMYTASGQHFFGTDNVVYWANDWQTVPSEDVIVCVMGSDRKPRPATKPFVHDTIAAAEREAIRLSEDNPGQTFGVYKRVSDAFAPVPPKPLAKITRRVA